MKSLVTKDWIFINDLVYKINSIENTRVMEKVFLETIRTIMPYDSATFYLAGDFGLDSSPVSVDLNPEDFVSTYIENMGIDYTKWIFSLSKSTVFRESDLFDEKERINMLYYKHIYQPLNIHYAAIVGLVHNEKFLGCCNFYNSAKNGDFSHKDVVILNILKDHLALRLYKDLTIVNEAINHNRLLLSETFCKKIDLTKKETAVFELIINGFSATEASEKLCISPNTLKNHLQSIYSKAGVKNKLELFRKASLIE